MADEILIVDDDEPIRRLVGHRIESAGHAVRISEDGKEAAALLEQGFEPKLVVLDVMMPRLDGKRLLRMIRNGAFPVDASVPVVLLTSRDREGNVVEGFDSGADDYVTKPFRSAELLARVEGAIGESHTSGQRP